MGSMNNVVRLPVIAGVEITTDEEGRFNLNALHKASGLGDHKRPSKWLATEPTQDLIRELETQSPLTGLAPINSVKGGKAPGTFAHELLAISYAGWISPAFQLKVNQVFLDYRSGKLKQPVIPQTLPDALRLAAELAEEREKLLPKADFYDKVVVTPDAISVAQAAKILGTGRRRLFAFLRQHGWVTRKNEPYQAKIESGHMDVKLGTWEHPDHGLQSAVTPLITGKGLAALQRIYHHDVA